MVDNMHIFDMCERVGCPILFIGNSTDGERYIQFPRASSDPLTENHVCVPVHFHGKFQPKQVG